MQMMRKRLTLVLALLAFSALGWGAAAADSSGTLVDGSRGVQSLSTSDSGTNADPDTPLILTKRLTRAPDSDGGRGFTPAWHQYSWIGRVWVSVYFGRWFAR